MIELRPFQRRFLAAATAPGIDVAALSMPRGNGKSSLAAYLLTRVMTETDPLFRPGTESVLCAASIQQARIVFRFLRADLEGAGPYRFVDSATRIGCLHTPTNTRLRIIGSSGRTAMGLVGCPWAVCDEPGSWEVLGGELMNDAIQTALGKPGSPMTVVFIGTKAPARDGWWPELVEAGSHGSTYVQALVGDPAKWDSYGEIRRCNPLISVSATFRRKLIAERDAARADTRLKARFLSYRLNVPSADESKMLLDVDDWQRVLARPAPPRAGKPICAYDLGGGRSWSGAVAIWRNGRCEAIACAPGIPDLAEQEKRDRVPAQTYRRLAATGALRVCEGLRVQPPAELHAAALASWGAPAVIYCDRFRLPELQDAVNGTSLVPRRSRWSEAAEDVRATRKMAKDGPLSVAEGSRDLLTASLAVATVKSDDQGSTRLAKRDSNNHARDDCAAAMVLACGAVSRAPAPRRVRRHALAG